jgi:hypothetical protein
MLTVATDQWRGRRPRGNAGGMGRKGLKGHIDLRAKTLVPKDLVG